MDNSSVKSHLALAMQVDDLVLDAVASDALDEVHKGLCCNTGIAENL